MRCSLLVAGKCPYTSQSSHPVLPSSFEMLSSSLGAPLGILSFNPGSLLPAELLLARAPRAALKSPKAGWFEHQTDFGGDEPGGQTQLLPVLPRQGNLGMRFMVQTQPQLQEGGQDFHILLPCLNLVGLRLLKTSFIQLGCAFSVWKPQNSPKLPNFLHADKATATQSRGNAQMPFCDLLGAFNVAVINLGVGKGGRNFPKLLASPFFQPTSEEPSLAVLFGD